MAKVFLLVLKEKNAKIMEMTESKSITQCNFLVKVLVSGFLVNALVSITTLVGEGILKMK